jgi:DNA-binding response OmpR family regulator
LERLVLMSKRILLIDDEKDVVHILKKKITAAGYEVEVAYNGKEGLEITHQKHPHLVLTDVVMPVMDGFAFYSELRQSEDISHIPVIVATAYGTTEHVFRDLGAKDFLIKPFDAKTVLEKVETFFKKQKAYKVLIATKMFYLVKNILNELPEVAQRLDLHLTNHQDTLLTDARLLNPDLIILDVGLCLNPAADEVVRELRAEKDLKETNILLIRNPLGDSSSRLKEPDQMIEDCLAKGASHFLGPLNRDSFLSAVEDYCH